jgi:prophage antirepressor-like protein
MSEIALNNHKKSEDNIKRSQAMANELIPTTKIAVFRKKEIRKTIHNNEWWFVIMDVVAALTDFAQPDGDIKDLRRRPRACQRLGENLRDRMTDLEHIFLDFIFA